MTVEIECRGSVKILRLNRPDKLNALSRHMLELLRHEISTAAEDPAIRAILLLGAGRAFSVGADLSDPMMGRDLPPDQAKLLTAEVLGGLMNGLILDLTHSPIPVVCAVNGIAAGGAVGLALAADITLLGDNATLKLGFVPQLGLVPDLGATWQLVRRLGRARARGICLLGADLTAQDALKTGLVWGSVPANDLEAEAIGLAQRLAAGPAGAMKATRALLDLAETADLETSLAGEANAQADAAISDEAKEGIAAFGQRRAADFAKIPRRV